MVWSDDGRSRFNFKPIDGTVGKTYAYSQRLVCMNPRIVSTARALILALLAACAGCDAASRVSTVVLATKGRVTVGDRRDASVGPGEFLTPAATVRTGPDGAVVLSPLPGVMIRLESNSELALDEVGLRKRGEEITARRVRARLARGRAQIWVDEFKLGGMDFRIWTAAGELDFAMPVLADLAVETDTAARVICASGGLVVAGIPVNAGQWIPLTTGSERPVAQEAADDNDRWATLLELRRIEPQLQELQARQRERTPAQFAGFRPQSAKN